MSADYWRVRSEEDEVEALRAMLHLADHRVAVDLDAVQPGRRGRLLLPPSGHAAVEETTLRLQVRATCIALIPASLCTADVLHLGRCQERDMYVPWRLALLARLAARRQETERVRDWIDWTVKARCLTDSGQQNLVADAVQCWFAEMPGPTEDMCALHVIREYRVDTLASVPPPESQATEWQAPDSQSTDWQVPATAEDSQQTVDGPTKSELRTAQEELAERLKDFDPGSQTLMPDREQNGSVAGRLFGR